MCLVRVHLEVTWFDMSYTLVRLSFISYGMSRLKNSHTSAALRHELLLGHCPVQLLPRSGG